MLNERRRRVLGALVQSYVSTAQPVGSKWLVDHWDLGCSPATVRNELAILEETGYVYQPHISAGRVPTDLGYRAFVDDLLESLDSLDATPERASHVEGLMRFAEVDDLMRQTSMMLSRLTSYMAVVLAPTVSLARVRRIDLLLMSPRRAVFVLIAESGRVVNRQIDLPGETTPESLSDTERALNASLVGKRAADVRPLRAALSGREEDRLVARVLDEIIDALDEADSDRLYHLGVPSLLALPEFADTDRVRPLLTLVEDGLSMLETLSDVIGESGVTVRIGRENVREELGNVSIVATHYGAGYNDGMLGVIGPTRMDYNKAISAVRDVAEDLSEALQ